MKKLMIMIAIVIGLSTSSAVAVTGENQLKLSAVVSKVGMDNMWSSDISFWIKGNMMPKETEADLIQFIIDNKHRLREISLRMVLKIADLWKMAPEKYKLLAENTCMKPERELQ